SLAAGQRSLALADVLRSGIELRDLRLELGFPLIELDGSPRSLAKFVKFGLEARVIPFPVVKRRLRLREVCCKLLLTILRSSSGSWNFFSAFSRARSRSLIAFRDVSASRARSAAAREAFSDPTSRSRTRASLAVSVVWRSARSFDWAPSFARWAFSSDSFS